VHACVGLSDTLSANFIGADDRYSD